MPMALPDREMKLETVKALWLQGVTTSRIVEQTGVKLQTIKTWVKRYRWTQFRVQVQKPLNDVIAATVRNRIEEQSAEARGLLADTVVKQARALQANRVTAGKLCTTRAGQGQAAVLKTISESANNVFGWNKTEGSAVNLAMFFNSQTETVPVVIEAPSESQPSEGG